MFHWLLSEEESNEHNPESFHVFDDGFKIGLTYHPALITSLIKGLVAGLELRQANSQKSVELAVSFYKSAQNLHKMNDNSTNE